MELIPDRLQEPLEAGIVRLIESHSGDGSVHVPKRTDPLLLANAIELGLVNDEGFITAKGRRVLAHSNASQYGQQI